MKPQLVGIAGWKHVGKTTVAARMVAYFSQRGLRVGAIKHDAHGFVASPVGTDTHTLSAAGAVAVAIASPDGHVACEWKLKQEPSLLELADRLGPVDLIVVEGYKEALIPKWIVLDELAEAHTAYQPPTYCQISDISRYVLGWIVPAGPLVVAGDSRGVYDRDNIAGICEETARLLSIAFTDEWSTE